MKLNERLAELRQEHEWTLRELRDQLEKQTGETVSISYLSELERGQAVPSIDVLSLLAQAYRLSVQDLLIPVDFYTGPSAGYYPESLRKFAEHEHLTEEWVETLARVEHRGKRPDTEIEWQAIYSMLRAFLEPKLSQRSGRS